MKIKRSLVVKLLLHVLLPLLIGFFIYVLYRPTVWITRYLNLGFDTKSNIKDHSLLENWLIFSGPDLCWAYSFASLIFILNHSLKFMSHAIVFVFILLLTETSEMLQLLLKPNFTFSVSDVIAILMACILSFFFNKKS